jgi:hypothetical protein
MNNTITSYEELLKSKQDLKSEIDAIEAEIKDHKLIKLSNVFTGHQSSKDTILESISSIGIKDVLNSPLGNLATSFFLTNKFIRKYFVGFTILKQTIPYAFSKLKDLLDDVTQKEDSELDGNNISTDK